jgi:hypothetical protein
MSGRSLASTAEREWISQGHTRDAWFQYRGPGTCRREDRGDACLSIRPHDGRAVPVRLSRSPLARRSAGVFVPGTTAERQLNRWLGREMSGVLAYADNRGRDACAFEPIDSRYLEVADDLRIRTPYSKTVVEELRAVPWAWWDGALEAWRVPFRSWEELRRRWPPIEAAARPAERRQRRSRVPHSRICAPSAACKRW